MNLSQRVREHAAELGFDAVGITPLRASDHAALYRAWLDAGHHGEMTYLAREDAVARRLDPVTGFPGLKSAIVLAHGYLGAPESAEQTSPERGVIARYARGRDYHIVLM